MHLDNEYDIPHLVSLCLPLPTCIDIGGFASNVFIIMSGRLYNKIEYQLILKFNRNGLVKESVNIEWKIKFDAK